MRNLILSFCFIMLFASGCAKPGLVGSFCGPLPEHSATSAIAADAAACLSELYPPGHTSLHLLQAVSYTHLDVYKRQQESYPAMLRDLDALALEYRFSSRFICLDQYDAAKEINSYRKGWRQQVYRFLDQFFNNPNARANRDALLMAEDAETALTEVQGRYVSAGYLTSCIVLMHEDQERLQDWARDLRRTVQTLGFGCRIESVNALEEMCIRDSPISSPFWKINRCT